MKMSKLASILLAFAAAFTMTSCNKESGGESEETSLEIDVSKGDVSVTDIITYRPESSTTSSTTSSEESSEESSESTSSTTTSEPTTSTPKPTSNGGTTKPSEKPPIVIEAPPEDTVIIELVKNAHKAIYDEDISGLMKYTDVAACYTKLRHTNTPMEAAVQIKSLYIDGKFMEHEHEEEEESADSSTDGYTETPVLEEFIVLQQWKKYDNQGIKFEPSEVLPYIVEKPNSDEVDDEIAQRLLAVYTYNMPENYFVDGIVFVRYVSPDAPAVQADKNGLGVIVLRINGEWKMHYEPLFANPSVVTKKMIDDAETEILKKYSYVEPNESGGHIEEPPVSTVSTTEDNTNPAPVA